MYRNSKANVDLEEPVKLQNITNNHQIDHIIDVVKPNNNNNNNDKMINSADKV